MLDFKSWGCSLGACGFVMRNPFLVSESARAATALAILLSGVRRISERTSLEKS